MSKNYIFSLTLFITTLITSILFFIRNKHYDRLYSMILLCYSFISFNDYLLYKSIESNDIELNNNATKNIYYLLWSQILFVGIGVYLISKDYHLIVLGIFILYYAHQNVRKTWLRTDITSTSNNTLVYGFDEKCINLLIFILFYSLFKYTNYKYSLPLILALFIPYYNVFNNNKNIGNWLYIPSLVSIPLYLISEYFYI